MKKTATFEELDQWLNEKQFCEATQYYIIRQMLLNYKELYPWESAYKICKYGFCQKAAKIVCETAPQSWEVFWHQVNKLKKTDTLSQALVIALLDELYLRNRQENGKIWRCQAYLQDSQNISNPLTAICLLLNTTSENIWFWELASVIALEKDLGMKKTFPFYSTLFHPGLTLSAEKDKRKRKYLPIILQEVSKELDSAGLMAILELLAKEKNDYFKSLLKDMAGYYVQNLSASQNFELLRLIMKNDNFSLIFKFNYLNQVLKYKNPYASFFTQFLPTAAELAKQLPKERKTLEKLYVLLPKIFKKLIKSNYFKQQTPAELFLPKIFKKLIKSNYFKQQTPAELFQLYLKEMLNHSLACFCHGEADDNKHILFPYRGSAKKLNAMRFLIELEQKYRPARAFYHLTMWAVYGCGRTEERTFIKAEVEKLMGKTEPQLFDKKKICEVISSYKTFDAYVQKIIQKYLTFIGQTCRNPEFLAFLNDFCQENQIEGENLQQALVALSKAVEEQKKQEEEQKKLAEAERKRILALLSDC